MKKYRMFQQKWDREPHSQREPQKTNTPTDDEEAICQRNMLRGRTRKDSNHTLKTEPDVQRWRNSPVSPAGDPHALNDVHYYLEWENEEEKEETEGAVRSAMQNKRKVTDEIMMMLFYSEILGYFASIMSSFRLLERKHPKYTFVFTQSVKTHKCLLNYTMCICRHISLKAVYSFIPIHILKVFTERFVHISLAAWFNISFLKTLIYFWLLTLFSMEACFCH